VPARTGRTVRSTCSGRWRSSLHELVEEGQSGLRVEATRDLREPMASLIPPPASDGGGSAHAGPRLSVPRLTVVSWLHSSPEFITALTATKPIAAHVRSRSPMRTAPIPTGVLSSVRMGTSGPAQVCRRSNSQRRKSHRRPRLNRMPATPLPRPLRRCSASFRRTGASRLMATDLGSACVTCPWAAASGRRQRHAKPTAQDRDQ
jgi:hypothetical protein